MDAMEAQREQLMVDLLEDISACGRIGGMMEGIARELQLLEWDEKDFPTLNRFCNGFYTSSLGRAIEALTWRVQDNLNHCEDLTRG